MIHFLEIIKYELEHFTLFLILENLSVNKIQRTSEILLIEINI